MTVMTRVTWYTGITRLTLMTRVTGIAGITRTTVMTGIVGRLHICADSYFRFL